MNISELLDLDGHIEAKMMPKSENQSHLNYSLLEPVLFEKKYTKLNYLDPYLELLLLPIGLTKTALSIFLHYAQNFAENL